MRKRSRNRGRRNAPRLHTNAPFLPYEVGFDGTTRAACSKRLRSRAHNVSSLASRATAIDQGVAVHLSRVVSDPHDDVSLREWMSGRGKLPQRPVHKELPARIIRPPWPIAGADPYVR